MGGTETYLRRAENLRAARATRTPRAGPIPADKPCLITADRAAEKGRRARVVTAAGTGRAKPEPRPAVQVRAAHLGCPRLPLRARHPRRVIRAADPRRVPRPILLVRPRARRDRAQPPRRHLPLPRLPPPPVRLRGALRSSTDWLHGDGGAPAPGEFFGTGSAASASTCHGWRCLAVAARSSGARIGSLAARGERHIPVGRGSPARAVKPTH